MSAFKKHQRVVIVGAGYGGLPLAFHLAAQTQKLRDSQKLSIALINPDSKQELSCEIYRTLRNGKAAFLPFAKTLKKLRVQHLEGSVAQIFPKEMRLEVRGAAQKEIHYDHLILASGSKPKNPQIEGLNELIQDKEPFEERIFHFKNNSQVRGLRLALRQIGWFDPLHQNQDKFVVVLGAGATGLEVAGEIAALRGRHKHLRVVLIDEGKTLLPDFSPLARKAVSKDLRALSVETLLGSRAKKIDSHKITLENGQEIPWNLVVLCSGKRTASLMTQSFPDVSHPQWGIKVNSYLQIENHENHYALGDLAHFVRQSQKPLSNQYQLPHNAQFAVQQGIYLARELGLTLKNPQHAWRSFEPRDLGYMVALGPFHGVGRVGPRPSNRLTQILSPYIHGPIVDQSKRLIAMKYRLQLRAPLFHVGLNF